MVISLATDGHLQARRHDALDVVLADQQLAPDVAHLRAGAGGLIAVHAAPTSALSLLAPDDLAPQSTIALPDDDPRDAAWLDANLVAVSLAARDAVAVLDVATGARVRQLPVGVEPTALAACGDAIYVLLRQPGDPSGAIAVLDARATEVRATIALTGPTPALDLVVDCAAQRLFVAEPTPVLLSAGGIEEVDLARRTSLGFFTDEGAIGGETGPFVFTAPRHGFVAMHTEFGSGPSSHLWPMPTSAGAAGTWDTFVRVDHLTFDAAAARLLLPDGCRDCAHPPGLMTFDATDGAPTRAAPLDVGFAPTDVIVAPGCP